MYFCAMEDVKGNKIHQNQVLDYVAKSGIDCVFFYPLLRLNKKGFQFYRRRGRNDPGVRYIGVPFFSYNLLSGPVVFVPIFIYSVILLSCVVAERRPKFIHARNHFSSIIAVAVGKIFGVRVISDFRGLYADEGVVMKRWGYNSIPYRFWIFLEKFIIRNSSSVTVISNEMKSHVCNDSYAGKKIRFVPAVVDSEKFFFSQPLRNSIRSGLGIPDASVVYIYVGSLGQWHTVDKLAELVRDHSSGNNLVDYRLLVLSSSVQVGDFPADFRDRVLVFSVEPSEVNGYLNAADFGVLPGSKMGGNSYDNIYKTMISSKCEEYLVAGLEVICDPRIVEVHAFMRVSEGLDREDRSKIFAQMFSLDSVSKKYSELYS